MLGMFVAACAMLPLAACEAGGAGNGKPPADSPSATPTAPSKEDRAREAVLKSYAGMRAEQVKAYAVGKASGTDLTKYASDKALARIESELFQFRQAGVVFKGKPTSKVTDLMLSLPAHKATVTECFDTSGWKAVAKSSGKDVTGKNQVRRYTVTGAVRTIGDRWMVVSLDMDKQRPC
ncbi:hypothetical protein ACIBK8_28535 [Streptomyces sp. NPDC050161]|uniref:hypothetical protein n=1 Tax=Streptomyces sp. NPDC050161 TaxID=3365604 RepID=UPI0037A1F33C